MKPSNQLIEKANSSKKNQNDEAVAWAELFMSIDIVGFGFTTFESALYNSKGERFMDSYDGSEKGIKFVLHLGISNEEDAFVTLASYFFENNKAKIASDSFDRELPGFLVGSPILGFSGTWEEVTYKIIELNDLINSQIPEIPK